MNDERGGRGELKAIGYYHALVPPEWIAAHGLRPRWIAPRSLGARSRVGTSRGVCPYAGACVDAALDGAASAGVVMTTTCDQMRYAAALVEQEGRVPCFLLNVPSTWRTAEASGLYREEVERLGRFLVRRGGTAPTPAGLARVMLEYDRARSALLADRERLAARQFAESLRNVGSADAAERWDRAEGCRRQATRVAGAPEGEERIALALVGGPFVAQDRAMLDRIERAGGRIVLNAADGGERTMPAPFDRARLEADPLGELTRAYFDSIPHVFRRPNDGLYAWLGRKLAEREVRGIVFRRYVWCDLWHAELDRLRRWSPVPVLDLDVADDDRSAGARATGRIEAFLETLRHVGRPAESRSSGETGKRIEPIGERPR